MVDFELPYLSINGTWSVGEIERTFAACVVPLLPAEAPPGTDDITRLSILEDFFNTILQAVQDNKALLFDGRDYIQAKPGHVETFGIASACGHTVHELARKYAELVWLRDSEPPLRRMRARRKANQRLQAWVRLHLEMWEPEVAILRRALVETARQ